MLNQTAATLKLQAKILIDSDPAKRAELNSLAAQTEVYIQQARDARNGRRAGALAVDRKNLLEQAAAVPYRTDRDALKTWLLASFDLQPRIAELKAETTRALETWDTAGAARLAIEVAAATELTRLYNNLVLPVLTRADHDGLDLALDRAREQMTGYLIGQAADSDWCSTSRVSNEVSLAFLSKIANAIKDMLNLGQQVRTYYCRPRS